MESLASALQKKKGQKEGAGNYIPHDLDALMDILEEQLPIGGKGRNLATDDFNEWAQDNGWPPHTSKSLEAKYKQVCLFTF